MQLYIYINTLRLKVKGIHKHPDVTPDLIYKFLHQELMRMSQFNQIFRCVLCVAVSSWTSWINYTDVEASSTLNISACFLVHTSTMTILYIVANKPHAINVMKFYRLYCWDRLYSDLIMFLWFLCQGYGAACQ